MIKCEINPSETPARCDERPLAAVLYSRFISPFHLTVGKRRRAFLSCLLLWFVAVFVVALTPGVGDFHIKRTGKLGGDFEKSA